MDISVSEEYCHLQDESKEHKNFVNTQPGCKKMTNHILRTGGTPYWPFPL
jgi:hypothetical protein